MPGRPMKPCAKIGCRELVSSPKRWCKDHEQPEKRRAWKDIDRVRGTATERGYDHRWAKYSRWYRSQHPLCVECERQGRVKPSEHVDHVQAVTGPDDPLFWAESNHEALCRPCHSRKTAKEDGGFGHRKKESGLNKSQRSTSANSINIIKLIV